MTVKIPEHFSAITPFLMTEDANRLLTFLKEGLGATEHYALYHPDGTLWHAQYAINGAMLMIADTMGQHPATPCMLFVYVEDADAAFDKAVKSGASVIAPPADQFYGARAGGVRDPFGNTWWLAQHQRDMTHEEMNRAAAEFLKQNPVSK